MPNWCDTTYKCVGSKKDLRKLFSILKKNDKRKTSRIKNSFGRMWIGNIIDALGFKWEEHRCRGEIIDYRLEDGILTIDQETAWCEQEGFRQCIEKAFPNIQVYFQEIEPGCGVFYTNSLEYFPDRYFLDSSIDWEWWENIDDAAKYCENVVGHEVEPTVQAITKAYDDFQEKQEEAGDDDCYFYFHEIELIGD